MSGVFTIAPERPFLDALAAGLAARAGSGDPLALSRMTVLLPTRRACRALGEAFLRLSDGRPTLLPRLQPIGDVEDDELEPLAGAPGDGELPPALPELRRRLLLARLIARWSRGRGADGASRIGFDQAARLASELARLIDEAQTEGLDLGRLRGLVPDAYAEHWQLTLSFLAIVTEHWPAILAEEGAIEAAERRDRLLRGRAEAWTRRPPDDWVVAAGSTGSIPATAALLTVVARLPKGAVVLPGLDRAMGEAAWTALESSHPQWGLARLLDRLEIARDAVAEWDDAPVLPAAARARFLSLALVPAAASESWRTASAPTAETFDGLAWVECPTTREEATVIALALRRALETPGRTAALVTPDRALARRVAAELARWDVEIDDSAGRPLGETPPGAFLRLLARALDEHLAPVALLALLKHPLAAAGASRVEFLDDVRALDLRVLRGPRPAPGLDGLRAAVAAARIAASDRVLVRTWVRLEALVDRLAAALAPVAALLAGTAPLPELLRAHVAAAEALAATDTTTGAARLWAGEQGEAAARFAASLDAAAAGLEPLDGADYPELFETLLAGEVVRTRHARQPRLAILGPLEARLQRFDVTVLGGLNEGTWPAEPAVDPWMSRPMRAAFGLAPHERRIGLAAHDFAQLAAAPEVMLTRARRAEGTPTVPSRWLARLDALIEALAPDAGRRLAADAAVWLGRTAALDRPAEIRPIERPMPCPPLERRPRRLSISDVERLLADPYTIYAKRVLRLAPLDDIDADPGLAERGQIIHRALGEFVRRYPKAMPADAEARLLELGRIAFAEALDRPGVWAFWWPRFRRIARWVVAAERARRPALDAIAGEIEGARALAGPRGLFTLTGRADRIERLPGGSLVIIDHKTGGTPTAAEVDRGEALQLPLEAWIAEAPDGFTGGVAGPAARLEYWRLTGRDAGGEIRVVAEGARAAELTAEAGRVLAALVARYDDPRATYAAAVEPDGDYAHLARVAEWSGLDPGRAARGVE